VPGKIKDLIKTRCHTLNSFYNYNIDIYEALQDKTVINVLDGVVSCEANNDPRILNTILIGQNPYSVDAVALKLINQKPEDSLLLNESVRRKHFEFNFDVVGDNIDCLICPDFHYTKFIDNVKPGSKASFKRNYKIKQKRPIISSKLCKGCKVCINSCEMCAIKMKNSNLGEYATIDYTKCISCFKCLDNCPYKIIKCKTPIKYLKIERFINKSFKQK